MKNISVSSIFFTINDSLFFGRLFVVTIFCPNQGSVWVQTPDY